MLSDFAHFIPLDNGNWAAFNSLLMDVLLVTNKEYEEIREGIISDLEFRNALFDAGILVRNAENDKRALATIRNTYMQQSGIINIVYMVLTTACNLKCKYCFLENNPNCDEKRIAMDFEVAILTLRKYITYLEKHNIEEVTLILYGGEPTLEVDLLKQIVGMCRKSNVYFDITVITNGTLIDEELALFLKSQNVNIGLSIDGPKKITDKNRVFRRSKKSVYDAAYSSKNILDRIGCSYGLSMVVSDYFLANQEEIIEWLSKTHEKGIFYNLLHSASSETNWKEHSRRSAEFIIKSYEIFERIESTIIDGKIQRQIDSFVKKQFTYSDCGAIGANQITVLPNGDICVCHGDSSDTKHHFSNIQNFDFESFRNSVEANLWIRRATIFNQECLKCEALFCCGGGCRHNADNLFGSRESIDFSYCEYVKEVLYWMIRRACYKAYTNSR